MTEIAAEVEFEPEADKTPIELSFIKKRPDGSPSVFVRNLCANEMREIEKPFNHYTIAAGPSKAGRIQEDQQEAYGDEVISRVVVDVNGNRLWPTRAAVAGLGLRRHNEVDRKVGAVLNGTEADGELRLLRGFWLLAQDYLRDDQHPSAVAADFWQVARRYVEDSRKNAPGSPTGNSSPAS